jgi:hypothetical protein
MAIDAMEYVPAPEKPNNLTIIIDRRKPLALSATRAVKSNTESLQIIAEVFFR